jgi:hypothetical protein
MNNELEEIYTQETRENSKFCISGVSVKIIRHPIKKKKELKRYFLIQLAKYETPTLCENLTEMRISSFCHT